MLHDIDLESLYLLHDALTEWGAEMDDHRKHYSDDEYEKRLGRYEQANKWLFNLIKQKQRELADG